MRRKSFPVRHASLLLIVWAVLASGCETVRVPEAAPSPAGQLIVGMRTEKVTELMGPADSVTRGTGNDYVEETWVYEIEHPPVYRTIAAEMQDVPWVDPITGEMKMLQEPITDQQRLDRVEKITLRFRHGQLMSIDRELDEHRAFSR